MRKPKTADARVRPRSLFARYFSTCVSIILLSIILLGAIFMVFASNYFKKDKYTLLEKNLNQVLRLTSYNLSYNLGGKLYVASSLPSYYGVISKSISADIFLADRDGNIILCSAEDGSQQSPSGKIPASITSQLLANGSYRETGKLGGVYGVAHYTVGMALPDANGHPVGAVYASTPAVSLNTFLADIFQMFSVSVLVMLLFSSVIIYIMTANLLRPVQEMLAATKAFSKGDFSIRVPVEGNDEVAQLAESFNSMASSLAIQEQSRRSFTANISHELKTPMTTIGGFIDGILDGTIPPEKQDYYLRIVSSETKRLSRLVRSMLDISRIEAGEMKINPKSISINNMMINVALIFEKQINDKKVDIRGLDMERHMVEADEDLIHQVVYNLVDNAVKFVNPGGYLEFSCREEAGKTYISIKNSGDGIASDELPRLFDRFYKTDKSRGLDKTGVGLGLYIVKTIVNLHGGEIFARSQQGSFTEFVFSLPTSPSRKNWFHKYDSGFSSADSSSA